tara:strand:- start:594 stop:1340 length:747 start_codon:yes stop_codon:yes gene_type:complete
MKLSDENKRERDFHDNLHKGEGERFENRFYKALGNMFVDFDQEIQNDCKDKNILDYGCGIGLNTEKYLKYLPKKITGIDISKISLQKARERVKLYENQKVEFKQDNCENLSLENESFELVYGTGVLHHLKLDLAIKEIARVLKKDGKIIFVEPLGTNPIINLYRWMTPKARSQDEHPFNEKDFAFMRNYFKDLKIKYYGFLTLIFYPFYGNQSSSKFFNLLSNFDQYLFKSRFLRKFAWSALIVGKKI